jgi:uncharacterized protein
MQLIGYFCAMLVGISLGILGSGGSILTLPIMVYLMNINPIDATGLSLFIVGITSATGGITYVQKKLVDLKTAVIFATPSIISVFYTRKLLMPLIPETIFSFSAFTLTKEILILILFALLMIVVGYNMVRKAGHPEITLEGIQKFNYPWLICIGLVSGLLTGILGVGGGFIIIPALVLYAKVPVRMSVGTSLLIIAVNSLSGFVEEVTAGNSEIDYKFLLLFALFSIAGIFLGFKISLKLRPVQLKKIFGWFIMLMGVCVLFKEIFFRAEG